jgi:L-glyceraldehyde 3-phosphate reductase
MTSVLIGASSIAQIEENVKTLERLSFTDDELKAIEAILAPG